MYLFVSLSLCVRECEYIYIYTHTHIYIDTRTLAHTHTHTHTYTHELTFENIYQEVEAAYQISGKWASSYILCHIIIPTMSHHHTYYVTSSYLN